MHMVWKSETAFHRCVHVCLVPLTHVWFLSNKSYKTRVRDRLQSPVQRLAIRYSSALLASYRERERERARVKQVLAPTDHVIATDHDSE